MTLRDDLKKLTGGGMNIYEAWDTAVEVIESMADEIDGTCPDTARWTKRTVLLNKRQAVAARVLNGELDHILEEHA